MDLVELSAPQRATRARQLAERAANYNRRCETLERRLHVRGVHDTTAKAIALTVVSATYDNDRDRYQAWCLESLLTAYRALGAQGCRVEPKLAIRASWQATEYMARGGGYWPDGLGDYFTEIRNAIEALL